MKKPKIVRKFADLQFKAATPDEMSGMANVPDGYIAGWASTDSMDYAGHVVEAGAFRKAIEERGLTGPRSIKLLLNHSARQVSGVIKKLQYDGGKLWIEAQLNLEVSYVKDLYAVAKDVGFNFSVGFFITKYVIEDDDNKETVVRIFEGDLFEVSIVPFPMNEEATVEFLKSLELEGDDAELSANLVSKRLASDLDTALEIVAEIKSHIARINAQSEEEKALAETQERERLAALAAQTEEEEQKALEAAQAKTLKDLTLRTQLHLLMAATAKMKAGLV